MYRYWMILQCVKTIGEVKFDESWEQLKSDVYSVRVEVLGLKIRKQ